MTSSLQVDLTHLRSDVVACTLLSCQGLTLIQVLCRNEKLQESALLASEVGPLRAGNQSMIILPNENGSAREASYEWILHMQVLLWA